MHSAMPGRRPGGRDPVGLLLVIGSALCYSALGILAKLAYAEGLTLRSMLAIRFTLGAILLWGWVLMHPELRRAVSCLPRARLTRLLLWGIFGFGVQSALFFSSLKLIPASLSQVLLYTCPAFVAIILWLTAGVRPGTTRLLAIGLALAGTALCAGPIQGAPEARGVALAVFTGLWYAMFTLRLDRLTPGIPAVLSGACIISGAALLFSLAVVPGGSFALPSTPAGWGAVIGMVLSATVFGFVLYVTGLKRVGAQSASILSTFEPLGALLLAGILLGERLSSGQWVGAGMIIGAAFVLAGMTRSEGSPLTALHADARNGRPDDRDPAPAAGAVDATAAASD